MKKLILICLLLSFILKTFSQLPEIQFDRISVQQGLTDHTINNIMQDHIGFIWIGGSSGLYKYDGYDFTFFKDQPGCKNCPPFGTVYKIQEDEFGFLWIMSSAGITLFDPERERAIVIYPFPADSINIKFGLHPDLLRDSEGNTWASSPTGLLKFSYLNTNGENSDHNLIFNEGGRTVYKNEDIQLSANEDGQNVAVSTLYEDNSGNIWVGCSSGLYLLRRGDHSFIKLDGNSENGKRPVLREIKAIVPRDENSYWILARNNLWLVSNIKMAFLDDITDPSLLLFTRKDIIGGQTPLSLIADSHNNFLLGTQKEIYKIITDINTGEITFELVRNSLTDPEDIGYNKRIQDVFEDRTGIIWAAQSYFGISKFNMIQTQFSSYKSLIIKNFKSADINPVLKDTKGNLWVGTFGGGLYKIQKDNFKVTQYDLDQSQDKIISMKEAPGGLFWLGLNPGILEFNSNNGKFRDPLPEGRIANNLRGSYVYDLLIDANNLFIGTLNGLFVFDISGKRLFQYSFIKNDSLSDSFNGIRSLLRLKNGDILTGTPLLGINKIDFNAEKGIISLVPFISNKLLSENEINLFQRYRLYEDGEGLLWIIDYSGLHSINLVTLEVRNYKLFKEIDFPGAWSITGDDSGNLWIGTHYGLCRFNKETGSVKIFNKENGVPITIHGFNSVYKDKDGRFYFGGIGGFYDFFPNNLKTNDSLPSIVITDFQIFNKSVKVEISDKPVLSKNISYTNTIELPYDQNDLSFKFAALDYTQPLKNGYAYKLEGFQREWVETNATNRTANYTKLDPGTYVFRVKGSNSDEIWNEEGTSLTIIIHKPWWNTTLACIIYLIVFISTLVAFIRWRLWRLGIEKGKLEQLVQTRTKQIEEQKEKILTQRNMLEEQNRKITESEELKSRFFTNVSHEFRTPLALIQSPVEELLVNPRRNEKEQRKLNMVLRNVHRLLNLVNQLLDISKIDNSKMKLELCEGDIMKYLRIISGSFTSIAETKNINYHSHFSSEMIPTWFDPDKLEKITTNLLFNAFKFTPEGGEIEFNASYIIRNDVTSPLLLEFIVKDSGIGISTKSLDKIFDRFYQAEESIKSESGGTGIGLSLARDLVNLMHGEIEVQSKQNKGSIFKVSFPIGKGHLNEDEYSVLNNIPEIIHFKPLLHLVNDSYESTGEDLTERSDKPTILIIDDNRDIRMQLSDNLESTYNIREAADGITGYRKATEIIPDLIITDLMMPVMNGLELCEKLKTDECTSHIPIILLTAKSALEDKVKGLETGADDYISKPFEMAELKVKVANLIEQRRIMRERFSREVTLEPLNISITPVDEKFLQKAMTIVEKHMSHENFDLDLFRQEMNMSRSTLFRKLFALTGQSPTDFIRTLRLKRAASLLKSNFGNITQISLEVGFNNLSYFNRSFKKIYGVSPTEYSKKIRKNE